MTYRPRPSSWPVWWVERDGNRPAGWTDGEFREPVNVARHLHPVRDHWTILGLLAVQGVRTRPEACACGGTVREYDDGQPARCLRAGCGWRGPTPSPTPTTTPNFGAEADW